MNVSHKYLNLYLPRAIWDIMSIKAVCICLCRLPVEVEQPRPAGLGYPGRPHQVALPAGLLHRAQLWKPDGSVTSVHFCAL